MSGIKKLKDICIEESIPIIEDESLDYIKTLIKENDILSILEIGTAYGYSAISFASISKNIKVDTIERDEERYLKAVEFIKEYELEDQITIHFSDALEYQTEELYDLIFIDGAKAQSINFFERFKHFLKEDGLIITDNMSFHGMVEQEEEIESKNLRSLVKKIKEYKQFLRTNQEFKTEIINIGDKLAVSKRI